MKNKNSLNELKEKLITSLIDDIKLIEEDKTFVNKRECRHCGEPIADQEHAAREFCEVIRNGDVLIKDCKTAYHRNLDLADRVKARNIINNLKDINLKIEAMTKKKGYIVSTDDLDVYEIKLTQAIDFREKGHEFEFEFLDYNIISNPISNQHKIYTHAK
jgi:hypothetical protein